MARRITSFLILFLVLAEPVLASIRPSDPYYSSQWYLSKVKADDAWEKMTESPDIVIAVVDSGVDISHPDLKDNIWVNTGEIPGNHKDDDGNGFIDDAQGWDFVDNVPDPAPKFKEGWTEAGVSHGTMVAGIIAARGNNRQGIAGVVWKAKLMPLRILDDKGDGKVSSVIKAIDYATKNGADIINLSFMNFTYSQGVQEAIARAHKAGVIVVAAAGNEQNGRGYDTAQTAIYPACYDGDLGENMVIGVAATDALDQKATFSSYGFRCVDISAPGISFFGATPRGTDKEAPEKYYDGFWSGTSMAAPLVSAALALIAQANPELSRREIVNTLFASADNVSRLNQEYLGQLGNGRLNVDRAIEIAKESLYSKTGRIVLLPLSSGQKTKLVAAGGAAVKEDFLGSSVAPGSSLAIGDVDGDGNDEIIVGAAKGASSITIFNAAGKRLNSFAAYGNSRFGVNVAAADIDNDGSEEIIAVPASASTAQVKIFDRQGKLKGQFLAADKKVIGGFSIAAGDLEGRGEKRIVVGFGSGQEPQVRIFSVSGGLKGVFLAYEKNFRGGVQVAVSNLYGRRERSRAAIVTVPGSGREALVRIFDNRARLQKQFLGYNKSWHGGANIAIGDIDNDGLQEIALAAKAGAAPHVRIFDAKGSLRESFYAWNESWSGGLNLGIIKIGN